MNNSKNKVVKLQDFSKLDLRRPVVLTAGAFDLLHSGHVSFLKRCKEFGATLIVGVSSDKLLKVRKGQSRPVIGQTDRAFMVSSLECVDYAVITDAPSESNEIIQKIKPDYLILSEENKDLKLNMLRPTLKKNPDLKVEFVATKFYKKFSTSAIIEKILNTCHHE